MREILSSLAVIVLGLVLLVSYVREISSAVIRKDFTGDVLKAVLGLPLALFIIYVGINVMFAGP